MHPALEGWSLWTSEEVPAPACFWPQNQAGQEYDRSKENWQRKRKRASLIAQLVKNPSVMQLRRLRFDSWVGKILWRRDRLPTPIFLGFPCGSAGKECACNGGDLGWIPGLRRSPGKGNGRPLSILAWRSPWTWIVRSFLITQVVKNPPAVQETPVQFLGREDPLEKGKATHSSILA